jgi:hypothetical protein
MMKKCIYFVFAVFMLYVSSTAHAGSSDLRFEEVYDIPFYQNPWVIVVTITAVTIGAAVVTTMTAGTGAPASAVGVSTVASAVAGGGAGSYMAGLSIIGGWVGGNAITGAAILNGASVALLGSSAYKGLSATTALFLKGLEAGEFGRSIILSDNTEKNDVYVIDLIPSDSIGTDKIENLLDALEDVNDEFEDEDITKETAAIRIKNIARDTRILVEQILNKPNPSSQEEKEDAVMGAVILYALGFADDFVKYITQIKVNAEEESYLIFLKSVAYFLTDDLTKASNYALRAMRSEPEAIEPVMIRIMALDKMDKYAEAIKLETAFEQFDDDHYKTSNSLKTAYNLLGDISSSQGIHSDASHYHKKAVGELNFFFNDDKRAILYMKIAHDYKNVGVKEKFMEYYEKAMDYVEDKELKQELMLMGRK